MQSNVSVTLLLKLEFRKLCFPPKEAVMLSVAQSIPETLQSVLNPYLMAINFHSIGRARLILSVNRLSTRTARTELYGCQINCTSLPFLSYFSLVSISACGHTPDAGGFSMFRIVCILWILGFVFVFSYEYFYRCIYVAAMIPRSSCVQSEGLILFLWERVLCIDGIEDWNNRAETSFIILLSGSEIAS